MVHGQRLWFGGQPPEAEKFNIKHHLNVSESEMPKCHFKSLECNKSTRNRRRRFKTVIPL